MKDFLAIAAVVGVGYFLLTRNAVAAPSVTSPIDYSGLPSFLPPPKPGFDWVLGWDGKYSQLPTGSMT